jgi:hypothetical protein
MAAVSRGKRSDFPPALVVPAGAAIEADGAALVIRPARRMARHSDQKIGILRPAARCGDHGRAKPRSIGDAPIRFSGNWLQLASTAGSTGA